MFRELRRKDKQLPAEEAADILRNGLYAVLALNGDDAYPYAVPVNYVYDGGKVYFHSATAGHKLDAIAKNGKTSLCVVEKADLSPATFNCFFRSVIVFGTARILDDDEEKRKALELLIKKYSPDYIDKGGKYIDAHWVKALVVEIDIEHITGKAAG
ncbi:MAG: pyridoxamine 5'-phosphate oxidase family protein [Clostridiales Family XIII bacterium]|nr:pyridoxamine 5'-phosphate oxidase family protein [Clostridiales Family XIII bacterium]